MNESIEFIEAAKVYVLFGILIFILLWRFWRDINVSQKTDDQFQLMHRNQEKIEIEHRNLIEQIESLGRRSADLSTALHRLDQNTSRLADNIRGDQAMTKAIEMARRGDDLSEIIQSTGLSHEEVEAIIHSHKEMNVNN